MNTSVSSTSGPLIDAHCHLGQSPAGYVTADRLIAHLDQNGVSFAIVSPGRVDAPADIPSANDMVIESVRAHPDRLMGFALADPTAQADAAAELERALDAGLKGVKLRPGVAGFAPSQHALQAVVELAASRRSPIYLHSGIQILSVVKDALRIAAEFPDLPVVLSYRKSASLEGLPGDPTPRPRNLYVDTSYLPADYIHGLLETLGADRVVFGSGFPFGSQRVEMSKAYHAVPAEAVPLVFQGNIRALLASCGIELPV
jgi:predicted TIM-barrel fold metal-dependent hydrolase